MMANGKYTCIHDYGEDASHQDQQVSSALLSGLELFKFSSNKTELSIWKKVTQLLVSQHFLDRG